MNDRKRIPARFTFCFISDTCALKGIFAQYSRHAAHFRHVYRQLKGKTMPKNKSEVRSFNDATGTIRYTLMNDYMFRIVFQENKYALL